MTTTPDHTDRGTLVLDPGPLEALAGRLDRAAEAVLDEPAPPLPDTGPSTSETLAALERLLTRTDALAGDVRALADVLEQVVGMIGATDEQVAERLAAVARTAGHERSGR